MEFEALGSVIGGVVAALSATVALFKARENRLTKKVELEQLGQKMLFERLQQLETRELIREKRVDELTMQLAEMRHRHDKLQWEYEELVKDYKDLQEQNKITMQHAEGLKEELLRLYASYEGDRAFRLPPRGKRP